MNNEIDTTDRAASGAGKAKPAAPATAEKLLKYKVLKGPLKLGRALCMAGAQVNVTQANAEAINKAQPDTLLFLGV